MKKRKKSLTLLEVIIALSLASILLTTVFSTYYQITVAHRKLEKAKEAVLSNKIIQQRLCYIFSHLSFEKKINSSTQTESIPPFYTSKLPDSKEIALILEYNNGIDPDPSFCGNIKSELYLTHENELCLMSYSLNGMKRKEIFKENISRWQMTFFEPLSKDPHTHSWDFEKEGAPPIVEIELFLNQEIEPLIFTFFLLEAEEEIIYKKKGLA